jgi:hypothetical protein
LESFHFGVFKFLGFPLLETVSLSSPVALSLLPLALPPFFTPELGRPATSGLVAGHVRFATSPPSKPNRPFGQPSPFAAVVSPER